MALKLQRSSIDPDFFEVWEGELVIQEIRVPFRINHFPKIFDSLDNLLRWIGEQEKKMARMYAYRLLAIKSYSSLTLTQKLRKRKYSAFVCEQIVEELKNNGYLNDEEIETAAILREFKKGYGPRYIEMKLSTKRARQIITREMQQKRIEQFMARCGKGKKSLQKLFRRGFDPDLLFEA